MQTIRNEPARRPAFRALLLAAAVLLLAGFGFAASEWWQHYSVVEEDLGDGSFRLTVTDDDTGQVDFEQVLQNGSGVLHLDNGSYVVVPPVSEEQAQAIVREIESGAR